MPIASERVKDSEDFRCGFCRREEFRFDGARNYGLYTGTLRALILQLKFRGRERLGERLGERMAVTWRAAAEAGVAEPPVLVPVPLHTSRQWQRGFNQAELLARGLARQLARERGGPALRVERHGLRRIRATPPQTGLTLRARHENVRGVFDVPAPEKVRDRVVVVVDDVMTTGATLSACAAALKDAGAARVLALTLARASPVFPDSVGEFPGGGVDDSRPPQR
jgi:ComF family protein